MRLEVIKDLCSLSWGGGGGKTEWILNFLFSSVVLQPTFLKVSGQYLVTIKTWLRTYFLLTYINLCSEILEEKSFSDHKYLLAEISIEYAEQEALPKMKRLNIGKANWDEFTINFNFPMSSFDSIDNIVDSFYHK